MPKIVTSKLYEAGDSRGDYTDPDGLPDGVIDAMNIDFLFAVLNVAAQQGDLQTAEALLLTVDLALLSDTNGDGLFTKFDALAAIGFSGFANGSGFDTQSWVNGLRLFDDFALVLHPQHSRFLL